MKVYVFFLLCMSVSGEVITLIKNESVTCVITEESLYSAIEIDPWPEFKRPVDIVEDYWNKTLKGVWKQCENNECAKDFDIVTDQRWEGFDTPCSEKEKHLGAVRLKEYRQFLSLYSNSTTIIKVSNDRFTKSTDIAFGPLGWSHYSLKRSGNYLEIRGDTISKNVSLDFKPELISFSSQERKKVCRKLHKYKFMYSNYSGESKIPIGSLKCIFMYVSVDENCVLEVKFEKNANSTNKIIEGFNQDKTLRKWIKFNITNNSDGPGYLHLHKYDGPSKTECFWAVAEMQNCRNRTEFYGLDLRNDTKQNNSHILCRTVSGNYNKSTAQITFSNKLFNCSEILGNSYADCEEQKICLENGSCFCSCGYKETYIETCQSRFRGQNCNNYCKIDWDKCVKDYSVIVNQNQNEKSLSVSNISDDISTIPTQTENWFKVPDSTKSEKEENVSTKISSDNNNITEKHITLTPKIQKTTKTTYQTPSTVKINGSFDDIGTNRRSKSVLIAAVTLGTFLMLISVVGITILICKRKKRRSRPELVHENEAILQEQHHNNSRCHDVMELQCANTILRQLFPKDMTIRITNNFDKQVRHFLNDLEFLEELVNYLNTITVKSDCICILSEEEKTKNRVRTILPGQSQIFLPESLTLSSTYINAITVDSYNHPKKFIVTQQPLPNTIDDFWILVSGYDIDTIVSLNHEHDPHCPIFWPTINNQLMLISDSCHITYLNSIDKDLYIITKVLVNHKKAVNLIVVKKWDRESTTPESVIVLLEIWDKLRTNSGQIIVTCYDGATASGLFVALAFLLEKMIKEKVCDVFTAVKTVRKNRFQFVQYSEQLTFLFKAALTYVQNSSSSE